MSTRRYGRVRGAASVALACAAAWLPGCTQEATTDNGSDTGGLLGDVQDGLPNTVMITYLCQYNADCGTVTGAVLGPDQPVVLFPAFSAWVLARAPRIHGVKVTFRNGQALKVPFVRRAPAAENEFTFAAHPTTQTDEYKTLITDNWVKNTPLTASSQTVVPVALLRLPDGPFKSATTNLGLVSLSLPNAPPPVELGFPTALLEQQSGRVPADGLVPAFPVRVDGIVAAGKVQKFGKGKGPVSRAVPLHSADEINLEHMQHVTSIVNAQAEALALGRYLVIDLLDGGGLVYQQRGSADGAPCSVGTTIAYGMSLGGGTFSFQRGLDAIRYEQDDSFSLRELRGWTARHEEAYRNAVLDELQMHRAVRPSYVEFLDALDRDPSSTRLHDTDGVVETHFARLDDEANFGSVRVASWINGVLTGWSVPPLPLVDP